jgi:hypothetical protein
MSLPPRSDPSRVPHIPGLTTRLGVGDGGFGLLLLSMARSSPCRRPGSWVSGC